MDYARFDCQMRRPAKDGAAERAHLEHAARMGHPAAIAALAGPPEPDALGYLYEWAQQLHGRSGVGIDGMAPLSLSAVESWARLYGIVPAPHEVDALFLLDAVMRNPDGWGDA